MNRKFAIVGLVVALSTQACATEVPAEEEGESSAALTSLSGAECELLDHTANEIFAFTLLVGAATAGCEGAVLVTTVGLGTPACLVPLTGAAAGALSGLLTRGAQILLCSGNRHVQVEARSSGASRAPAQAEHCPSGARRTCNDATWTDVNDRKANACNRPRSCASTTSCAVIRANIAAGSQCLTARDRITNACCDGQTDAAHVNERNNVLTTLRRCQEAANTHGCN